MSSTVPVHRLLFVTIVALFTTSANGSLAGFRSSAERDYTTNAMCLKKACVNPIFPGLAELGFNAKNKTWQCAASNQAWKLAGFCNRLVMGYQFAVPRPVGTGIEMTEADIIKQQARDAMTTYVAHMSGLGKEVWDHTDPWEHDECVQNVWKMACYTHFPRCNAIDNSQYLRPCMSSCQSYIRSCQVECCDEATQCVFQHITKKADGTTLLQEGYVDHNGPSPMCTGSGQRRFPESRGLTLFLLSAAFFLVTVK